jgi:hypothetical protein
MAYDIGTIKLVWIPNDYTQMESIMFDSIPAAMNQVQQSGRKDYMLMRLMESDGRYYKWEVLPYGSWNGYNYGMKIFKNPVFLVGFIGLSVFGAYKLFKDGI